MKNLKLIVFSLISVIMVTIFLTSCEKTEVEKSTTKGITETQVPASNLSVIENEAIKNGSVKLFLPEEIALDSDKIVEYLHSLSSEKLYQHILTHKIVYFLGTTNNFEKFHQENPKYTFLTMDDVYKYAPNNVEEFRDFDPYKSNNITLRGCTTVASSCFGSVLIETDKCCSEIFGINFNCEYEIDYIYGSSQCNDPCSNVACGFTQYCNNGYCYDNPTCPPCEADEICIGTTCTPM